MKKITLSMVLFASLVTTGQNNLLKNNGFENTPASGRYLEGADSVYLRVSTYQFGGTVVKTSNDTPAAPYEYITPGIWYKKAPVSENVKMVLDPNISNSGKNSLKLLIRSGSSITSHDKYYNASVFQHLLSFDASKTYVLRFRAKKDDYTNSNVADKIYAGIGESKNGTKLLVKTIALNTQNPTAWNQYAYTFNMPSEIAAATANSADFNYGSMVVFGIVTTYTNGLTNPASVFIDDIELIEETTNLIKTQDVVLSIHTSRNFLSISTCETASVSLYGVDSKVVEKTDKTKIHLFNPKSGVYFVRIESANNLTETKKIIIP